MDARTDDPKHDTIADRIAAAQRQRTSIKMPDPDAPTEAPADMSSLGTATPAMQHVYALLCELRNEHGAVAQAHKDADGTDEEATAAAAHEQLHEDMHRVKRALVKLFDAEFNPDRKAMTYVILADWTITGKEQEEPEIPEILKLLLGGLGAKGGLDIEVDGDLPPELAALLKGDPDIEVDGELPPGLKALLQGDGHIGIIPGKDGIMGILRVKRGRPSDLEDILAKLAEESDGPTPDDDGSDPVIGSAIRAALTEALFGRKGSDSRSAMDAIMQALSQGGVSAEDTGHVSVTVDMNVTVKIDRPDTDEPDRKD